MHPCRHINGGVRPWDGKSPLSLAAAVLLIITRMPKATRMPDVAEIAEVAQVIPVQLWLPNIIEALNTLPTLLQRFEWNILNMHVMWHHAKGVCYRWLM